MDQDNRIEIRIASTAKARLQEICHRRGIMVSEYLRDLVESAVAAQPSETIDRTPPGRPVRKPAAPFSLADGPGTCRGCGVRGFAPKVIFVDVKDITSVDILLVQCIITP